MSLKRNGFTLVELMVAMALTGIAMAAIYKTFASQQKVFVVQEQVAQAQQEGRAAIDLIVREIRMAGFNPRGGEKRGIVVAQAGLVRFTHDANGNNNTLASSTQVTDPDEDITFTLSQNAAGETVVLDKQSYSLAYNPGNPATFRNVVADNVDALDFVYLDSAGAVIATPIANQADLDRIRSIQISIVVKTTKQDKDFTTSQAFENLQGAVIFTVPSSPSEEKQKRRRLFQTTVQCRNLGL